MLTQFFRLKNLDKVKSHSEAEGKGDRCGFVLFRWLSGWLYAALALSVISNRSLGVQSSNSQNRISNSRANCLRVSFS